MLSEAEKILQKYWGYPNFRKPQDQIVEAALRGEDCLALLPTGGGKSICYQIPALMKPGLTLVISPLISLMQDQVDQLKRRGIDAAYIQSGLSRAEVENIINNAVFGAYQMLYVSPERLQSDFFREKLPQMNLSMIAVDEAHCISQWGYDFRPAYTKIKEIRKIRPDVPTMALTATATPLVVKDICAQLNIAPEKTISKSFHRDNLSLAIRRAEDKPFMMLKILKAIEGSAIVYTRSRRACEQLVRHLKKNGMKADFYHAGLSSVERFKKQELWMKGINPIMVATNAFGMGIDKSDVRLVIHYQSPENLEAYFQEAGRAGRDGAHSYAVLLCSAEDKIKLEEQFVKEKPSLQSCRHIYHLLGHFFKLNPGEGKGRSFAFSIDKFCSQYRLKPAEVLAALKVLKQQNLIQVEAGFSGKSSLQITASISDLYSWSERNRLQGDILQTLLRSYGGILDDQINIEEEKIANALNLKPASLLEEFKKMEKLNLIRYQSAHSGNSILFLEPLQDAKYLRLDMKLSILLQDENNKRLAAMLDYISQDEECRSKLILEYFGEKKVKNCGLCDVCRKGKQKHANKDLQSRILEELQQGKLDVRTLSLRLADIDQDELLGFCRHLLEIETLGLTEDQELYIKT